MQHKSQNSTLLIREQCPWQLLSNNGGGPSTFQRNEPTHLHCYMTFSEMEQGQGLLISMLILSGLGEMSSSFWFLPSSSRSLNHIAGALFCTQDAGAAFSNFSFTYWTKIEYKDPVYGGYSVEKAASTASWSKLFILGLCDTHGFKIRARC